MLVNGILHKGDKIIVRGMQENYFSFSFVLRFTVEQILGILAAIVIIKLLQKNGENSTRMDDNIPRDMVTLESL